MEDKKTVLFEPASPLEIERVAKALYAASHINRGVHGKVISPWSNRLRDESGEHSRKIWEGLAIAAIDMANGAATRL